jgi:tight adherence protein B
MAHLISGVRAGLSLAECCSALSKRGPEELRAGFGALAATYAATGSFDAALTRLQESLEDPVADRVVAVLRMAHAVGGNDLVRLLRTTAELIREDLRIRGEIRARWSWTVTAARLAAAAPFLVLLMMSTRPEAAAAYASDPGTATIIVGSSVSFLGYRLMLRAARLPEERRSR